MEEEEVTQTEMLREIKTMDLNLSEDNKLQRPSRRTTQVIGVPLHRAIHQSIKLKPLHGATIPTLDLVKQTMSKMKVDGTLRLL